MLRIKLFISAIVVLAFIGTGLRLAKTLYDTRATGTLQVAASDKNANLAISRANSQASNIGKGDTSVRLKPGTYLVSAAEQGTSVTATVTVAKQHTSSVTLDIASQLKRANEENALLGQLPTVGPAFSYKIDYVMKYDSNGQSSPTITITSEDEAAKQAALSWISYQGINPADFDIHYTTANLVSNTYNEFVGN